MEEQSIELVLSDRNGRKDSPLLPTGQEKAAAVSPPPTIAWSSM